MNAKYHIMLIEDNPDHSVLIRGIILQLKNVVKISMCHDGQQALEALLKAKKNKCLPDLILLDLKLPRISGLELLHICKESQNFRHIPIVVLSSSEIEKDVKAAMKLGASDYLVKPMNLAQLYDRLDTIIKNIFEVETV